MKRKNQRIRLYLAGMIALVSTVALAATPWAAQLQSLLESSLFGSSKAPVSVAEPEQVKLGATSGRWTAPVAPEFQEVNADEIVSGKTYYFKNVGAGQYLAGGNSWATQASFTWMGLDDTQREALRILVKDDAANYSSGGTTVRVYGYSLRLDGSFSSWGTSNREAWTVGNTLIFRDSETSGFVDYNNQGRGVLWKITKVAGTGYYRIQTAPEDPAFPNAATQYAGWLNNGYPIQVENGQLIGSPNTAVRFDLTAGDNDAFIDWLLIPTEASQEAMNRYNALLSLYEALVEAENAGVDEDVLSAAGDVYVNEEATETELLAAKTTLQLAIKLANPEQYPVDITEVLQNPAFDAGNIGGWETNYVSGQQAQNIGYQSASYTNGTSTLNGFIEAWRPGAAIGDGYLQQTVFGLPAGTYRLYCDAIASWQNSASVVVKGAELFIQSGNLVATTNLATGNGLPEEFSVDFDNDGGQALTFGLRTVGTTANWIAADNFQIFYVGELKESPHYKQLKSFLAKVQEEYDADAVICNADAKNQLNDAIATADAITDEASDEACDDAYTALSVSYDAVQASVKAYEPMTTFLNQNGKLAQLEAQVAENKWSTLSQSLADVRSTLTQRCEAGLFADKEISAAIADVQSLIRTWVSENMNEIQAGTDLTILLENAGFEDGVWRGGWDAADDEVQPDKDYGTFPGWTIVSGNITKALHVIEVYHRRFNFCQTIPNMPAGVYDITVQGFVRHDDASVTDQTVFYAGDLMTSLMERSAQWSEFPIYNPSTMGDPCEGANEDQEVTNAIGNSVYVPNGMSGFYFWTFEENTEGGSQGYVKWQKGDKYYTNHIKATLKESGDFTIGLKSTATTDWIILDNFRITYLGDGGAAYVAMAEEKIAEVAAAIESEVNAPYLTAKATDDYAALEKTDLETITSVEAYEAFAAQCDALISYIKEGTSLAKSLMSLLVDYETRAGFVDAEMDAFFEKLNEVQGKLDQRGYADNQALAAAPAELAQAWTACIMAYAVDNTELFGNATALIRSPKYYDYNELPTLSGWSLQKEENVTYGNYLANYGAAEVWQPSGPFKHYQSLSGLLEGYYLLTVDAYDSNGQNYAQPSNAYLFGASSVDSYQVAIKNVSAGALEYGPGSDINVNYIEWKTAEGELKSGYTPGNLYAAAFYFNGVFDENPDLVGLEGEDYDVSVYRNKLLVQVGQDGNLTIGISGETVSRNDWIVFSNWTLTYMGTELSTPAYRELQNVLATVNKQFDAETPAWAEATGFLQQSIESASKLTAQDSNDAVVMATSTLNAAFKQWQASVSAYQRLQAFLAEDGQLAKYEALATAYQWTEVSADLAAKRADIEAGYSKGSYKDEDIAALYSECEAIFRSSLQTAFEAAAAAGEPLAQPLDITPLFSDMSFAYSENQATYVQGYPEENPVWVNETKTNAFKTGYGSAEVWNVRPFNIYREFTNLPKGKYTIKAHAFYRVTANDENYANYWDGVYADTEYAYLYANNNRTNLTNVAELAFTESLPGTTEVIGVEGQPVYIVNSQQSAYKLFTEAAYADLASKAYVGVSANVLKDGGTFKAGIAGTENLQDNQWTLFYNFELYYEGVQGLNGDIQDLLDQLTALDPCGVTATDQLVADAVTAGQAAIDQARDIQAAAVQQMEDALAAVKLSGELTEQISNLYDEYQQKKDELDGTFTDETLSGILAEIAAGFEASAFKSNAQIQGWIDALPGAWVDYILSMEELAEASETNPVELPIIVNGNFADCVNSFQGIPNGWKAEYTNNGGRGREQVMEFWNAQPFDFYQDLSKLKPGYYRLSVDGFYRAGDANDEAQVYAYYEEPFNETYLYAGDSMKKLMQWSNTEKGAIHYIDEDSTRYVVDDELNILYEFEEIEGGVSYDYEYDRCLYAPNSQLTLKNFVAAGRYHNTLTFAYTEGAVRIGIQKIESVSRDWCPFTNFKLEYLGTTAPASEAYMELQDYIAQIEGLYDATIPASQSSKTNLEKALATAKALTTAASDDECQTAREALGSAYNVWQRSVQPYQNLQENLAKISQQYDAEEPASQSSRDDVANAVAEAQAVLNGTSEMSPDTAWQSVVNAMNVWTSSKSQYAALNEYISGKLANYIATTTANGWTGLTESLTTTKTTLQTVYETGSMTDTEVAEAMEGVLADIREWVGENMASIKKGDDLTLMLVNADFSEGIYGPTEAKQLSPAAAERYGWNIPGWTISSGNIKELRPSTGNIESWHQQFDFNQTIPNMPAGVYDITVQGFVRHDDASDTDGMVFYAGDTETTLMLNEDQWSTVGIFTEETIDNGITPTLGDANVDRTFEVLDDETPQTAYRCNGMTGFYYWSITENTTGDSQAYDKWQQGDKYYTNHIKVTLTETGDFTIGLRSASTTDWVIWDNFQITYLGDDAEQYREMAVDKLAELTRVYDASVKTTKATTDYNALAANAPDFANITGVATYSAFAKACDALVAYIREGDALAASLQDLIASYEMRAEAADFDASSFMADLTGAQALLENGAADNATLAAVPITLGKAWTEAVMSNADVTKFGNATAVIYNPSYVSYLSEQEYTLNGWIMDAENLSGFGSYRAAANIAEIWHPQSNFNHYQTIEGLPAGFYRLTVDAYSSANGQERKEVYDEVKDEYSYTAWNRSFVYGATSVGTFETPLKSRMIGVQPNQIEGVSTSYESFYDAEDNFYEGYLPNNVDAARYYFQNILDDAPMTVGLEGEDANVSIYRNSLIVEVGEDGKLTIGITSNDDFADYDWVAFDNWTLSYCGETLPTEAQKNIVVSNQMALNVDAQEYPEGFKPNIILKASTTAPTSTSQASTLGALTVETKATFSVGKLTMNYYPAQQNYYRYYDYGSTYYAAQSNSVITKGSMRADSIEIRMKVTDGKWNFICLPYDVRVSDITCDEDADWVIRAYDGEQRAASNFDNTWVNVADDAILEAGKGYILHCNNNPSWFYNACTFHFPSLNTVNKNNLFSTQDLATALAEYPSEFLHNQSWNFIGNPYAAFIEIGKTNLNAPIVVWKGDGYVVYTPEDDAYVLSPGEAFFVQRPIQQESVSFAAEGRRSWYDVRNGNYNVKAQIRESKSDRSVFNLILSDGEQSDRARVVINPASVASYELSRDASKFFSLDAKVPQLFTIADGINYAINERPLADGIVQLAARFGQTGTYTLTLQTTVREKITLIDTFEGTSVELGAEDSYSFSAEAGTVSNRFLLVFGDATAIRDITAENLKDARIYSLDGKVLPSTKPAPGVYLIEKNGKVQKVSIK